MRKILQLEVIKSTPVHCKALQEIKLTKLCSLFFQQPGSKQVSDWLRCISILTLLHFLVNNNKNNNSNNKFNFIALSLKDPKHFTIIRIKKKQNNYKMITVFLVTLVNSSPRRCATKVLKYMWKVVFFFF